MFTVEFIEDGSIFPLEKAFDLGLSEQNPPFDPGAIVSALPGPILPLVLELGNVLVTQKIGPKGPKSTAMLLTKMGETKSEYQRFVVGK